MQTAQQSIPHSAGTNLRRGPVSTNLASALYYAHAGIAVFPCDARKRPLTPRGHHDATSDLDAIRRWWARWRDALVGIPTGPDSGVWVLDVDGEAGRQSLNQLMARLRVETIADLTPCVSRTPGGGLHLIFRLQPGELPRNRARDIGAGLDTRGVKADGTSAGYFVAPGSRLPDGRRYGQVDAATLEAIEAPAEPFAKAALAPRGLVYLASFGASERAVIAACPELQEAIRASEPAGWSPVLDRHQAAQRAALAAHRVERVAVGKADHDRQRRYAEAILARELPALASMSPGSGRNHAAFKLVCRAGRWVHGGVLERDRLVADVLDACAANGLLREAGRRAVLATIESALARSAGDALPDLEARHG